MRGCVMRDAETRPQCLRCRRPMISQLDKRGALPRWTCRGCGASCRKTYTRRDGRAPNHEDHARRPWCVRCRRLMLVDGPGKFRCHACRANASAVTQHYRQRRGVVGSACRTCGHPKTVRGYRRGRPHFACQRCYRRRRVLRQCPETVAALLVRITASLPGYLTAEEREDASQSIMLDMLAGKLAAEVPEPETLKAYAGQARGMSGDRFRFVSLSAPTRDGREFGETLAA